MSDLVFILLTVVFFAAVALVARRAAGTESSTDPEGRRR